MAKTTMTFEQSQEAVAEIMGAMSKTRDFQIGNPIDSYILAMADAIEEGENEKAIVIGADIVSTGTRQAPSLPALLGHRQATRGQPGADGTLHQDHQPPARRGGLRQGPHRTPPEAPG
ncbi:MAG: hypothetical protein CEO12_37 [Parcubacteria group bacterium Gr01-1014_46]|nr:MAG: hypothetical protein CEO12_37 [Parcubacteria group bacterium Gr01-1014_46]